MFQRAWSIYTASFVDFERRSLFEHRHVMRQPRYRFSAILRDQDVVGVIGMWSLPGFCFIEHVAIADAFRSAGLGQRALRAVQRHAVDPVVLDVEPFGTDFFAARRVTFYRRLGFHYCGHPVTLPPYAGKTTEPSNLMAWPMALDEASRVQVVETIEREIYGLHPLIPRHRAV
ncbi:MAG TPA: GNAT family N-acetyltransferase [Kiritimatiellia bacterium]|nr:GNAT family N-acetyltransferase [Kiritimatiellia bacterium]HRU70175.1 GNAT family N-acetyltransferase [Kiritimatiellia bacterium]